MPTSFRLPDLGEGVHEAEILSLAVTVGQAIREGEPLIEVETDKAAVEIPSPATGIVSEIHVQPGDIAHVGDILVSFTTGDEQPAVQSAPAAAQQTATEIKGAVPLHDPKRPVPASPSTRRLARELGVDLHDVPASSDNGVVSKEDVERFANSQSAEPPAQPPENALKNAGDSPVFNEPGPPPMPPAGPLPDFSRFGPVERLPFRSIRRATAQRMVTSWTQIPHVHCQDMVDITLLEEFRQRHKQEIAAAGGRLTMTVFALKAIATALKTYPQFNASLDLEQQEIIIKHYFHIGVAVDTEHGLMVPVIRDVDRKSIKELAIELHGAIDRAKERKSTRDELIGGSFTVTNVGPMGGYQFSAIINHPEIAILGLGQARLQPMVVPARDGGHTIEPRLMMPIVLCFDHRVADGADAIRFLQVIINSLGDPDELLITMI